jgi:hypothetical protein
VAILRAGAIPVRARAGRGGRHGGRRGFRRLPARLLPRPEPDGHPADQRRRETPLQNEALGTWDVSGLNGLYTLLLTVQREDGSFSEASVPVTVDNTPPTWQIRFPIANQSIFHRRRVGDRPGAGARRRLLETASSSMWTMPGSRSRRRPCPPSPSAGASRGRAAGTFHVVAVDAAGNRARSEPVRVCLVERGG